jgi:histone H3/H4
LDFSADFSVTIFVLLCTHAREKMPKLQQSNSTPSKSTVVKKKQKRLASGDKAKLHVKKWQATNATRIPYTTFARAARRVLLFSAQKHRIGTLNPRKTFDPKNIRMSKKMIIKLQILVENEIIEVLERAKAEADHRGAATLRLKDLEAAKAQKYGKWDQNKLTM